MVRFRNQVKVLTKVKSLSPNHRIVIALYSPGGVVETGLPMCPPEKRARKLACGGSVGQFLQSGLTAKLAELRRRFLAIFGAMQPNFLCIPDCVAERVGFEADCKGQLKDLMRHGQRTKLM